MSNNRALGVPLARRTHRRKWRRPPGTRGVLFAALLILVALASGSATTYARRAAARGSHVSSVHQQHRGPLAAGLVAAWGFGGGTGGTGARIADASGHGHALTLVNSVLTRAGKYGGAVRFTGHDSFATVPEVRSLNLTSGMTLEAWVRPSKLARGHATIIAKTRAGGGFPYGLRLIDGRPYTYGRIGGRFVKAGAKTRLPENRWSFLAATYDGSTLRLYVGSRVAAKLAVKGAIRKSVGPLQIGGDQVRGEFFIGSIDNVRIFSKARSPQQLGRDRRTPVAGGLIHGPVSTTGPGGTGPGNGSTGSAGAGTSGVAAVGQGASAGIALPAPAGPPVYVSQTTAGADDGSSCANAHSAGWFNTASNWGTGAGEIGPGDVVHLCGTISSDLTVQGNGSAGSPITIYFEPGATLSQPACAGACLLMSNRSYVTIDGGGTGVIQNTANGTGLADNVADEAIAADSCTNCTIEYLTIQNIYVRTSESDTGAGAGGTKCISVSGDNLTVMYNTMDYADWCVNVDETRRVDSNMQVYGNNISNTDHGFALAFYETSANGGPFYFYDNYVHDYAAWDTGTQDLYHHDGFHCYATGGGTPDISGGLYLYNNIFGGRVSNGNVDNGGNDTAQIFLEGGSSTRCATPDTPIYLFNNVDEASPSGTAPDDAYWALSSGTIYAYNNTLLGNGSDVCFEFNIQTTPAATVENSLISGCAYLIGNGPPGYPYGGLIPDYNVYAASSSNAFRCNGTLYAFSAFSSWKSCIGGDSHSTTTANADVNSDGSLQSGSPAVAAGENLYSRCNGQPNPGLGALCANITGVPRPASGRWTTGAY